MEPTEVARLEGLIGNLLLELEYPLSQPLAARLDLRLRALRRLYPAYYDLKEWLKTATPMGRLVNTNRLHLDEVDEVVSKQNGLPVTCIAQKG